VCSTTFLASRPARPRRPGRHQGAAADLPGLDLAAQGNATALLKVLVDPPASGLPAGGHGRPHGVPRAARRRRVGGPALLDNQGVATGSWGAAKFATSSSPGSGDQAEQFKLRTSHASALLPSVIGPVRLGSHGSPELSNNGGYLGKRRWRWPAPKISPIPVSVLPARGRVAPTRDPTRVRTRPISGSTRTPNSQRRSRMDRNMTRGYPTSHRHTPSPLSGVAQRALRALRRRAGAGDGNRLGGRWQHWVPTPG